MSFIKHKGSGQQADLKEIFHDSVFRILVKQFAGDLKYLQMLQPSVKTQIYALYCKGCD